MTSPCTSSSLTPRADDLARAFEPCDRNSPRLVQAGHFGRRLLPAHVAKDGAGVDDAGTRRLEGALEAVADRAVRAACPELEPDVALQPAQRLQFIRDETSAVPVALAGKEARVPGDGEGTGQDRLAFGLEVDETVMVDVHRDAVGGRPLHRTLRLVPHAQIAAHVVEALRRGEEEAVDSRRGHLGANTLKTPGEFLFVEGHLGFGRGVEVHLVAVCHGVLPEAPGRGEGESVVDRGAGAGGAHRLGREAWSRRGSEDTVWCSPPTWRRAIGGGSRIFSATALRSVSIAHTSPPCGSAPGSICRYPVR